MKKNKLTIAMGLLTSGLLVACGGSDDSAPSGEGTISAGGVIVITGVDGYYQNALVFDDIDSDGVLDIGSDTILGLTNSSGQLTYNYSGDLDSVIQGSIALQTLVPGGDKQQELIEYDADTYSGVYTIDTDFPDTALDTEMVLRTPLSSASETDEHEDDDESYTAVVSPISDLVSIQIASGQSEDDAKTAVATALGVAADKLYSDYADEDTGDTTIQKKAQILAESKSYAITEGEDYDASATTVAEQTASTVSSMTTDQINDDTNVPVVLIESESGSVVITVETNTAATVNNTLFNTIQDELSDLDMTGEINWSKDISGLFSDSDQSSLTIKLDDIPDVDETGITVALDGNTLQVTATEVLSTDDVTFNLYIEDKTSEATTVGKAIASFTLSNSAPTADSTEASELQTVIDGWSMRAGDAFSDSFSIVDLFNDEDSDTLSYTFSPNTVNGLAITAKDGTVTVAGTPKKDTVTEDTADTVYDFSVIASDGKKYANVTFTLPEILEEDTDGDGVADSEDAFPEDATETTDSDGDGVGDNADAFDDDATETTDTDGDGVGDNSDAFPNDATETTDTDGDGVGDNSDAFPNDATETTDTDGDGYGDNSDAFPNDATEWLDSDGDGIGDNSDTDDSDELSASDFADTRFYALWTQSDDTHKIMTFLFSSEGEDIDTGYGYIDEGEEAYFNDYTDWEITDGDLILTDWGVRLSLLERGSNYLKVCWSDDVETSATCTDDDADILYSDKDAAQTYVAENASALTEINLSSITDSVLNEYFTNTEYSYAENVYNVYIEGMSVESLAGMSQFTNLAKLYADDNHISDISPLSGLADMNYLYLENQTDADTGDDINLESYDPVLTMTSLTRLKLSEFGDDLPEQFDLAGFLDNHSDKSTMTRLQLYGVEVDGEDVDAITDMPNLERIVLEEIDGINDLTGLESNNWTNLTQLNLGWNNQSTIDESDEPENNLVEFNLSNMIDADLNLEQLTSVDLSLTTLSADDITTLASGVGDNLESLQLRKLATGDYSGLFDNLVAPNLTSLKLGDSLTAAADYDMADINNNITPSKLTTLYLNGYSQGASISNFAIADFTSLTKLRLRGSDITDTTVAEFEAAINSLDSLTELDITKGFSIQGTEVYCSELDLNDGIECESDSLDTFTEDWLEGKTLYQVWWGNDDEDSDEDAAYAYKLVFSSDNALSAEKLVGGTGTLSGYYAVSDGKLKASDNLDELTDFSGDYNSITDGSTDDYIKTYWYDEDGTCDNVDLYFFDEDTAISYANSLTGTIDGGCDTDGDGILNDVDSDDDGDGVADESDSFPFDASEYADSDGDGIGDNADNCPTTSNSDQTDADDDGIGDVCESSDADDIATAQSFMTDVRTAYESVQDGGDLSTGLESFATELDDIDVLVSDDIDTVTANIALAVDAIAEAVDNEVTSFPYTAENGVEVALSGNVYSVTSPATVTATVTKYDADYTETDIDYSADCTTANPCTASEDSNADINLSIEVSASSNGVSLTGNGTVLVETMVSTEDESYVNESTDGTYTESGEENGEFTVENVDINLTSATLSYADTEFTGSIQITMNGVENIWDDSWSYESSSEYDATENETTDTNTNSESSSDSFTVSSASLVIDGDLTGKDDDGNDASAGVYLSISIDNSLGYSNTDSWGFTNTWTNVYDGLGWYVDSSNDYTVDEDEVSEETEDSYVKFDVTARVTTDVTDAANNAVAASVELVADREEYESMDVQITVDYNNVDTVFAATYGIQTDLLSNLTISNESGAEAVLTNIDDITGIIYINGLAVASIEEANGMTIIRYSDGTFETIY